MQLLCEGTDRDQNCYQVYTGDVGVSLHSKTHLLFMLYSNDMCYMFTNISANFFAFCAIPYLIQRNFSPLFLLASSKTHGTVVPSIQGLPQYLYFLHTFGNSVLALNLKLLMIVQCNTCQNKAHAYKIPLRVIFSMLLFF